MKILIVTATSLELTPFLEHLEKVGTKKSFFEYEYKGHSIFPLTTGVGSMVTAYALSRFPDIKNIDLAINAGICGAYDRSLNLGDVVEIDQDRFADLGVEEADASFTDIYELELENGSRFPYKDGWLYNESKYGSRKQKAISVTVNTVSGTQATIDKRLKKYKPQTESMEGAAFLYACKTMDVDCIQLRAISNYVEPRNRDNWQIAKALDNLNQSIIQYIDKL
jgi:futalosine hydrolase